jgi:hypothetical protein
MAYVDKAKKAKIKAALDAVVPKSWKWSLAVDNHTSIVFTVYRGPRELTVIPEHMSFGELVPERTADHRQINERHIGTQFPPGEVLEVAKKIVAALNTDNFDKSDIQSDYFHVGHYVNFNVGRWNKPFEVIETKTAPAPSKIVMDQVVLDDFIHARLGDENEGVTVWIEDNAGKSNLVFLSWSNLDKLSKMRKTPS